MQRADTNRLRHAEMQRGKETTQDMAKTETICRI
jgi:hypothetical protein